MLAYQLTRPVSYLTIEHPEKWKFDWLVPGILTTITLIFISLLRSEINIYGIDGLLDRTSAFIQILPGFYIAALAAIATFNRPGMDKYMPDPAPTAKLLVNEHKNIVSLTRRRFLAMLFAFLTAESILIILLSLFATTFAAPIKTVLPFAATVKPFLDFLFIGFYFLLFWQMVTATSLGLYYLGERLHQSDNTDSEDT